MQKKLLFEARGSRFVSLRPWRLLVLLALLLGPVGAWAQTTKTLPGDYANFTTAINDINTNFATGGVTVNVAAGYTETSAAALPLLTAQGVGGATGQIIFQKSGAGANPKITAQLNGASTTVDGIVRLNGADYVTFDGIDLSENASNITATTQMEFGYALFRPLTTNGCQNNTFKNCVITLNKTNVSTFGIYGAGGVSTATTTVAATTTAGANSFNKVDGCIITNSATGIYFTASTSTTLANYDQSNEIGVVAANQIYNFGTTATGWGIGGNYQNGFKVVNNTVNSTLNYASGSTSAIAASTVTSTLRGVYGNAAPSASITITGNTITLASGAATSGVTGIDNGIGGTAASNTVTITGNTLTNCTYATATTGAFTGISNSASAATVNINNNFVTNNTLPGTGNMVLITGGSPTALNINANTITGNAKTGTIASGTMYCIQAGTAVVTANNNTISTNSITATGTSSATLYGYYNGGSPTVETLTGNIVTGLTINGASTSTGHTLSGLRFFATGADVLTLTQNTIGTLAVGGSGSGTVAGIYNSSAAGTNSATTRNKIYDLSAAGTSGLLYGIYTAAGSPIIANNLIGNLTSPTSTNAVAVSGIQVAGGTAPKLYYNTIYLNASSTGGTFGTSGVYLSITSTDVTLLNNIVVNTSTPGATGVTAALRRTAVAFTGYNSASSNNLYYAGGTYALYYDGTTQYTNATTPTFKTAVAPREASSITTENPPFLSTTSGSTFLHINSTVATQVESGGIPISGITADFDGDTRSVTTPDIGADEGSFTPSDLTPPAITYTALGSTVSTTNRTLTATITDASGVATGAGAPLIYYRNSTLGGSYFSAVATSVSGSSYTFTINYANIGGTPASGNVIQYYVAAQDASANNNTGTSPSGGSGINPPGSAAPGTPNSYTILPTLAGNYYVGTGAHIPAATYATLTAAAAAYNGTNLGGAINFILIDPTYTTAETFPITFNANSDASAVNRLTINPESGVNATISGSNTTALLVLNGADYVTLDGSNNGTNSRNLTLANAGAGGTTVLLNGAGTGSGATNDVLRNLTITASASTSGCGISVGGATGGSTGADNDNVTIQNNSIQQAFLGIYVGGTAAASAGGADGLSIVGNLVGPAASGTGNIGGTGLSMTNAVAPSVTGNTVQNVGQATATSLTVGMNFSAGVSNAIVTGNTISGVTVAAGGFDAMGLNLGAGFTGGTVDRNRVLNIVSNTSTYGGRGIDVNTGSATSNLRISNNFVAGINGSGWSSFASDAIVGIRILGTTTGGISLYYNSVNLSGSYSVASASVYQSAALYVASTVTALDVRDNIFTNTLVNGTSASKAYALYSAAPKAAFTLINYNDYFVGAGTQAFLGNLGGTGTSVAATGDMTTLAAFQATTGTGQDANSLAVDPAFASATDLHTASPVLNAAATPIAGITTDFDGQTRDATVPDIGADEFTPPMDDAGVAAITQLVTPFAASVQNIAVQVKNYGAATLNTVTVSYTVNGVAQTPQSLTGLALAPGATSADLVLGTYDFSVGGPSFVIVAITSVPNGNTDPNTANDSFTRTVTPALCGTYAVGAGQPFVTLDAAVTALNARGASCAVTFTLTDATYPATSGIIINQYPGNSSVNTLTIKPGTGVTAAITGSVAGAIIKINGAQYVTLDGSNNGSASQNWSLTNGTGSGASLVQLGSSATGVVPANNMVKNLVLTGAASATTFTTSFGIQLAVATPATTGASNNTFQNNAITKVQTGISAVGLSATVRDVNTTITGNQIGSATAAAGFGGAAALGITASNQNTLSITGNVVRNPVIVAAGATATGATALISSSTLIGIDLSSNVTTATVSNNTVRDLLTSGGTSSASVAGIRVGSGSGTAVTGATLNANLVTNVKTTNTGGFGAYGIVVNTGTTNAATLLSNNMVSDINSSSNYALFANSSSAGIYLTGTQSGISVVYNSVNMYGTSTYASAVNTAALAVESGSTGLTVRNNVLANGLVGSSTGSKPYSLYSNAPAAAYTAINNNDYYSYGSQAAQPVLLYFGAADRTTLSAVQTATTQDAASITTDPAVTAPNDLHSSSAALNAAATPIAGITTDFDGQTRDATVPDIGADEFTPQTLDIKPVALSAPSATQLCFTNAEPVTVQIQNNAASTVDFSMSNATVTVVATPPSGTAQTFTTTLNTGTLAASATQNVTFTTGGANGNGTLNMTALGTYSFAVTATVAGDGNTANDVLTPAPTRSTTPQATLPYLETFNASTSLPTNFTTVGFSVNSTHGNASTNGLTYNLYSTSTYGSAATPAMATTPILGTTTSANNVLTFDARFVNYTSYPATATTLGASDRVDVQVSVCGGAYATVYTINSANYNGGGAASTSFYNYSVPLTGVGSGQKVQVRLAAYYGAGDYYLDLDNFNVQSLVNTDLMPTALAAPSTTQGCYGATEVVAVTVKNQGATTLDFTVNPATVTVNVTGTTTATLTGNIGTGTLAPGATQNVTLAPTLNMSAYGTYTFAINATVTGDLNTANDNLTPNPTITTVAPVAGTIAPASTTICNSGTATLTLTGSANGSIQYQQSPDNVTFTNVATGGTTATYTTPVLTSTTYYRAQTICGANVVTSNVATVTVNTPLITSASPTQTICSGSTATVTANGSSGTTVRFFANATGGTALATGTAGAATASYTTPALTANTPYYAEAFTGGTEVVGKTAPNTTGSLSSGGLIFNVTGATTLKTVTVYSIGASGTVSIQLQNAAGTVIQTGTGTVAAGTASVPVASVITLNFNLVTGTGYKLIQGGGTSITLVRDDNTAGNNSFPYTSSGGTVSITDGTLSGYYYSFYNWQISNECASASRTPVQVTVNPQPTFTTTRANASCFGSSTGSITVSATGGVAGGTYEYSKNNGTTYQASNVFNGLAANTYQVVVRNLGGTQCAAPAQAVTITQPASALAVTATKTDETAAGSSDGTVTGTATGGTSPYQYSLNGGSFSTANVFSGLAPGSYTLTVTDAGGCAATSNTVTVGPGACSTDTWNGAVSADWFTPGNWSCGQIPTATIDAAIPAGLTNYPNLTTTATAAVRALTIANGASLSQSAGTLNVYGNLTNSAAVGNVSLTGGTMAFLGTMPTITGSLAMYDLTTNLSSPSGVLALSSNITVNHALTMTQGVLNTGTTYAVTLPVGATVTESDASYVLGRIAAPSRNLSTATAETFGGMGLTLTPNAASGAFPGLTNVVRTTGTVLTGVGTSVSIKRYFDIVPATNTGLNVTMDFTYLDHERNGVAAGNVALFKSVTGTSGPWANQTPITITGNSVNKSGITGFSVWTLGSATTPLPVELSAFDARRQDNDAALTWATASEKSNHGFEVQVSTDGHTFRELGFVAGAGTSSAPHAYAHLDREASKTGLRYYRLRQLDFNGTATFSPVRIVAFGATAETSLSAVPNPFATALTLVVQARAAAHPVLTVTDAQGRTVLTQEVTIPAGRSAVPVPGAAALPTGFYLLHLSLDGESLHVKAIKH